MYNHIIEKFIKNVVFDYEIDPLYLSKRIDIYLSKIQDFDLIKTDLIEFTLYGEFTNKISEIDKNIILVYRYKEKREHEPTDYFGFIYFKHSIYLEYYIELESCFTRRKINPYIFHYIYLTTPSLFDNYNYQNYTNVKNLISDETYDLIVEFLLKKTNNRLRNTIFKVFY